MDNKGYENCMILAQSSIVFVIAKSVWQLAEPDYLKNDRNDLPYALQSIQMAYRHCLVQCKAAGMVILELVTAGLLALTCDPIVKIQE